jgi:hypothetical protein
MALFMALFMADSPRLIDLNMVDACPPPPRKARMPQGTIKRHSPRVDAKSRAGGAPLLGFEGSDLLAGERAAQPKGSLIQELHRNKIRFTDYS